MADLNVSIGATITDLKTALNTAKSELGGVSDAADKSAKEVSTNFKKSSEAVQLLDSKTGGLASSLIDVGDAAKLSGTAMKSALVSTGIGALVVALGFVIQHWEDIVNFIDDSNIKMQEHINSIKRASEALEGELKLSQIKEKILIAEGKSTDDILEARKKIIGQIQFQNVQELNSLIAQDAKLDGLAAEYTWWEKIKKAAAEASGLPITVLPEYTEEEAKANAEREKGISNLKIAIEETKLSAIELNNELAGIGESKKGASPLASLVKIYSDARDELQPIVQDINKLVSESFVIPKRMVTDAEIRAAEFLDLLNNFNDDAKELIVGSISDTFGNLGTAIGEALANGENVFSAMGNSLLQSMGAFLSDMGGLLIEYGTLAIAKGVLDKAIDAGGTVAIIAGIAAIGVGIALKAAGAAIGARANGGTDGASSGVSGGGSSSNNNYNTGSQSSGGFSGGTVVFEIAGTKLVGVLSNTLSRNRSLGGTLSLS